MSSLNYLFFYHFVEVSDVWSLVFFYMNSDAAEKWCVGGDGFHGVFGGGMWWWVFWFGSGAAS